MSASSSSSSARRHLFTTHTLCPKCAFAERKGFEWRDADVVEEDARVVLHAACPSHGPIRIQYCSHEPFFARLASFSPGRAETTPIPTDIEDITARFSFVKDTPIIVHVDLSLRGAVRPAHDIISALHTATTGFPPNTDYTVSLNCGTVRDIPAINSRAAALRDACPPRCPVLVSLPPVAVAKLADHSDTVFLRGGIYPSIRTHITHGEEPAAVQEIADACSRLRSISGLHAVLSVTINPPYAALRLHPLLTLIRQYKDIIRFLILEAERSTQDVLESIQGNNNNNNNMDMDMDVLSPVNAVVTGSQGMLRQDDFYPVSAGMVLEPLLHAAGLGRFCIRPSPFCASGTAILDTEINNNNNSNNNIENNNNIDGVPLPRILDMHRVFDRMLPVLRKQQQKHRHGDREAALGWRQARTVKKAFSGSVKDGERMPDVFADVLGGHGDGGEVMGRLQFVIIHHRMDVANMDSKRRSRCTVCEVQADGSKVAACTHCL